MTSLLAGPDRRCSYPQGGFKVTVVVRIQWPEGDIPSDVEPRIRYYPFTRAVEAASVYVIQWADKLNNRIAVLTAADLRS
jgi:hypothetical protein